MIINLRSFLLMGLFLLPILGGAFPETARHGYVSCATCHHSPSGRGLLTSYGKTIAQELYSAWPRELPETQGDDSWWQWGAQIRLMQWFQDTPTVQKARLFPMQMELEGALTKDTWSVVGSMGVWRPMDASPKEYKAYSRNHYLLLKPQETWTLRIGHFRISHGLGLPDHGILTQQYLGWSHSHETYNLEATYNDDNNVIQASWITPSLVEATGERISGGSATFSRAIASQHKVGINLSKFKRDGIDELQANFHAVVSISEVAFLQSELAQRYRVLTPQLSQTAFFARYSRQWGQGWRPFLQWEASRSNEIGEPVAQRYFLGSEWFPIANFDLLMFGGREINSLRENQFLFSGVGHFYF